MFRRGWKLTLIICLNVEDLAEEVAEPELSNSAKYVYQVEHNRRVKRVDLSDI